MNKASTAKVYTILNGLMKSYYQPYPLLYLDIFVSDLRKAGIKARVEDAEFPFEFFEEACNAVIRWFMKGYPGLTENRIGPMLQAVWAFHKECMERPDATDADMDYLVDRANILAGAVEQPDERALYTAVLHEYDRASKRSEQSQPNSGVKE